MDKSCFCFLTDKLFTFHNKFAYLCGFRQVGSLTKSGLNNCQNYGHSVFGQCQPSVLEIILPLLICQIMYKPLLSLYRSYLVFCRVNLLVGTRKLENVGLVKWMQLYTYRVQPVSKSDIFSFSNSDQFMNAAFSSHVITKTHTDVIKQRLGLDRGPRTKLINYLT